MQLNESYFAGMAVSLRNAIALGEEYVIRYVRGEIEMAYFRGQMGVVGEGFNRVAIGSLGIPEGDVFLPHTDADDTGDLRSLRMEVTECGDGSLEGTGEERLLDYAS